MKDYIPPENNRPVSPIPQARAHYRYFSAIWILPIIAALVAGYLGFRSYAGRGPQVTVTFVSGEGLSAGQTPVKYKAVTVGTVESVNLSKDLSKVVVSVRMTSAANSMLTENARFWVVRPRLNTPLSSLETLVSGTYIAIQPGDPGSDKKTSFDGLENPPNIDSDEPGTTYVLKVAKLGSIGPGTPIFFRDANVGEVLGYTIPDSTSPITVNILVRAPYDEYVKPSSRFWNASGLSVKTSGGVHVEFQSLQSVLSGGIAFSSPPDAADADPAEPKTTFQLYENSTAAENVDHIKPVEYVSYFQASVKDLTPGSPVQIFGVRVGAVKDVKLVVDPQKPEARIRVAFNVQPDKAFGLADPNADPAKVARQMVEGGMRVRMESSDLLVGQEVLSLEFAPGAAKADVTVEGDSLVLPGQAGGMDHLTDAIGDIAGKLNQIPFDQIGAHLNHLLAAADETLGGPEMQQSIHSLAATLANAEDISKKANANLTPALQRLPEISAQLQGAVTHANDFMASVNAGYGQNSDFQHELQRVMTEVNDASRSIRLLADFLERHPEALIQGKSGDGGKQ